jgi:hypothetical protein
MKTDLTSLTEILNLTCQNGKTRNHLSQIRAVIRTAQQLKYAGRGAEATGFAGPPHGVRSRKVL